MAQSIIRTMSFASDSTYEADSTPLAAVSDETIPVGLSTLTFYGVYEWNFNAALTADTPLSSTVTVESVSIKFYTRDADSGSPSDTISFVLPAAQPSTRVGGAAGFIADIITPAQTYTTKQLFGDAKQLVEVALGSSSTDQACVDLSAAINADTWWAVALSPATTRNNLIDIGGQQMVAGEGSGWSVPNFQSDSSPTTPEDPPKVVFTYSVAPTATRSEPEMRYTTADPTSQQLTPSNSIGGYLASNIVYVRAEIDESLGSLETTIPITSTSPFAVLPTSSSGIAQVGPEIIRYSAVDTSNSKLTGVTRAISPSSSFPSSLEPQAEFVHYLEIDSLFDKRPTTGLVQHRCVSFVLNTAVTIENVEILLRQSSGADVQADVGIEVPAFDMHTGTIITPSGSMFTSISPDVVTGFSEGFFAGGHVILDTAGSATEAIIESYDVTGGTAEFILDRAIPVSVVNGELFRINPAPSQTISNDRVAPVENSSLFLGFLGDGGPNNIGFGNIREQNDVMRQFDAFYLWVKRTLKSNIKGTLDTGAVIILRYRVQ